MTKITLRESMRHAIDGIGRCLVHERNFRIHTVAAVTVVLFAWLYGVDTGQRAMLAVAVATVMTMEMMNTAIEAVVDLITQEKNEYAKIAKDVAAGMVVLAALCGHCIPRLDADRRRHKNAVQLVVVWLADRRLCRCSGLVYLWLEIPQWILV